MRKIPTHFKKKRIIIKKLLQIKEIHSIGLYNLQPFCAMSNRKLLYSIDGLGIDKDEKKAFI